MPSRGKDCTWVGEGASVRKPRILQYSSTSAVPVGELGTRKKRTHASNHSVPALWLYPDWCGELSESRILGPPDHLQADPPKYLEYPRSCTLFPTYHANIVLPTYQSRKRGLSLNPRAQSQPYSELNSASTIALRVPWWYDNPNSRML